MSNSKKKRTDQLTPVKTKICNDGDGDDLSFMGSPPLLPFDDAAEYKKLRQAASKSMTGDFLGQFCSRMLTDALWEARRYQQVVTNLIKADLAHYPEIEDPQTRAPMRSRTGWTSLSAFIGSSYQGSIVSMPFIDSQNSTAPAWVTWWLPVQKKLRMPNSGK